MDKNIIGQLMQFTEEEHDILQGQSVRQDDYTSSKRFIVNSAKILGGKELDLRPHTRFIEFPEHGHDYMEFMYVYQGSISHIIGGETISLEQGDILFLNRHIKHSIKRAGQDDIGINFILSNPFLQVIFPRVQNSFVMSDFLSNNFDDAGEAEYLFFRAKENFPIRNLMDNLIYAVVNRSQELYAELVSLLFTYLAYYRDTLVNALRVASPDAELRRSVLSYLERHYPNATLTELSRKLGYSQAYLSRRIGSVFGKSFRSLLQQQRIAAAEILLRTTKLGIEEIARSVGYENQSHFYRTFFKSYGVTPHTYRKNAD